MKRCGDWRHNYTPKVFIAILLIASGVVATFELLFGPTSHHWLKLLIYGILLVIVLIVMFLDWNDLPKDDDSSGTSF